MEDLWEASRRGNVASIRRYVNAYGAAKLNEFNKKGLTPLFLAASEDKLDAVELLVSNGADVNLKSKGGYTALMIAASEGYTKVAQFLIDRGADLNIANDNGWTSLICAASFNHLSCVQILLLQSCIEFDRCSNTGCSALYFAAREGFTGVTEALLRHGANVNITSLSGYTPLHIAAEQGHLKVVDLLLDAQADPTLLDQTGRNAWQIAKTSEIQERLYTKTLKRAIKSQPSFLIDVDAPLSIPFTSTSSVGEQTNSLNSADQDFGKNFLTTRQQLSLAQFASSASSDVLSYLSQFGQQQQQSREEMDYILQHPALTDFYLYFHRSVSTTILGFQTLFSQLVVDNRQSQGEQITEMIDSLAQSSNIAAIPLITGILKEVVKFPNDTQRSQVLNKVTKCFPSVDSHRILEVLARELTLEERDFIQQTMRMTKTMSNQTAVLQTLKRSAGWLYETFVLRGEESQYYSFNPVQALATTYASQLLDKLMLVPVKKANQYSLSPKAGIAESPPLVVSYPVAVHDLPVLKCFALDLDSLDTYYERRARQQTQEIDTIRSQMNRISKPLPVTPPRTPSSTADQQSAITSRSQTPPTKPMRSRGSSSPAVPTVLHGSIETEGAASASAQVSPKSNHNEEEEEEVVVEKEVEVEGEASNSTTVLLLQERLSLLESTLSQDQAQQQERITSLTLELNHLRKLVNQRSRVPTDTVSIGSSPSSRTQLQLQLREQQQNADSNQAWSGNTGDVVQERQEQRFASYDQVLQSMIVQLQSLQEDVHELHHGTGSTSSAVWNSNSRAEVCSNGVRPVPGPVPWALTSLQESGIPGVDVGADDPPDRLASVAYGTLDLHHQQQLVGVGGCCVVS